MPSSSPARVSLPERYRVVRHVANGGMASVWEAHDELLDRSVAVKLLASHLSEDDRARQRFQREARAAAGLSNHPNVATIYDVGEFEGRTFIVMELLTGGSLADRLRSGEPVSRETALRWLREAASALDAAHVAGVVHRDVKPANMLIDEHGRLAIADFGIARIALEDQLTATGQVLGTAAYISPEQAVGDPATAASDRYALAVVAYELLTGGRPFEAENFAAQARAHVEDDPAPATSRNPDLPGAVDAVLARGLAKEPAERYGSAGELVSALEHAMEPPREPTPAPAPRTARTRKLAGTAPPPPREPSRAADGYERPPRRSRAGVLLAALAGLVLVGFVVGLLLFGGGDDPSTKGASATSTPTAQKKKSSTPTPSPTAQSTPEQTATASPTASASPAAPAASSGGKQDLAKARRLQLQGYDARQAGDYAKALKLSQQALDACAGSRSMDPCGYALFEKGAALNRSGRSAEAIPVLQQRLKMYGDNPAGEVKKELDDAKKKAGQG